MINIVIPTEKETEPATIVFNKRIFFLKTWIIIMSIGFLALGQINARGTKPWLDPIEGSVQKIATDTPPVAELRSLYHHNKQFRRLIDLMMKNVQGPIYGKPNPWEGKTFNDLCYFFNQWYSFLPTSENGLHFIRWFQAIYYQNKYGLEFIGQDPGREWLEKFIIARGKYLDSPESSKGIAHWLKADHLHLNDYQIPRGGFKSFNDFFTRTLKPGVRPIDSEGDEAIIVSPADCLIKKLDLVLTTKTKIPVKGRQKLNVAVLLNGSTFAQKFVGGTAISCILEPTFYHHFHAPVSGLLVQSEENVRGIYFDRRDDFSVFEQYHRGYYIFKTNNYGYVAMVSVGLATVGSVVFESKFRKVTPENPVPIRKGERIGHFAYGGSLIILLFEPNRLQEITVSQGQRIGIFQK